MKEGRTLTELAQEIERQRGARKDFVADTRAIAVVPTMDEETFEKYQLGTDDEPIEGPNDIALRFGTNGGESIFPLSETAHRQVATRLGIPAKYYERLRTTHPDLLANDVEALFERESERRMIRTLDGKARAFLSDRYRPLDNDELLESVLPVLHDLQVEIKSCEVTEHRMYIKFVTPRIQGEVGVGDVVQAGGVISNSEIGLGTVKISDLDFRLVCLNGMIREVVAKQTHVGRHTGIEGMDASEFFKDETRAADDKALFLKLRDTVSAMFRQERFDARLAQYREAKEDAIEHPIEVVEVAAKRFALPEGQRESVLTALLRDGDLSRWGLANALTRASQDVRDYDAATDLEALGGKVIELPPRDFSSLKSEAKRLNESKSAA